MPTDVVSARALNRATLGRQLLLERSDLAPHEAVHHVVGLQAQEPLNPYVGLWSRLRDFVPDDLGHLLLDRTVVRSAAVRGTIHLLTADDVRWLWPLSTPVLEREMGTHRDYAPVLKSIDVEPVLAFARPLLEERPRSQRELRRLLAEAFPGHDPGALALACRNRLGLVQVPPRGVWGQKGEVTTTTIEAWLDQSLDPTPSVEAMIVRYLTAFGPGTAADIATWSRLTGIAEVLERLAPRLRQFRDERGRALWDVPDAPLPDPDTPAPVRFLPEYDNVFLAHAGPARVASDRPWPDFALGKGPHRGAVLLDGIVDATWRLDGATVEVRPRGPLTRALRRDLEAEAGSLASFLAPGGDVRLVAAA